MTIKKAPLFERLEKKYGELTFANTLKAWRDADEMSQVAFAKRLGISTQNLNDIEKGRRIPSPKRAARIAKKLGIPDIAFVMLSVRDSLRKEGFDYKVSLKDAS